MLGVVSGRPIHYTDVLIACILMLCWVASRQRPSSVDLHMPWRVPLRDVESPVQPPVILAPTPYTHGGARLLLVFPNGTIAMFPLPPSLDGSRNEVRERGERFPPDEMNMSWSTAMMPCDESKPTGARQSHIHSPNRRIRVSQTVAYRVFDRKFD